jgi:hypothetical protein
LADLAYVIGKKYDEDFLGWLYDAAYVASWWVEANWSRYRFEPGPKEGGK